MPAFCWEGFAGKFFNWDLVQVLQVVILVFALGNSFTSEVVVLRRLVPVLEYSLKL